MTGRTFLAITVAALALTQARAADGPIAQVNDPYYVDAAKHLQDVAKRVPNTRRAKNIILFVGDGMGVTTVTAARIRQGQVAGRDGVSNKLVFETLPYAAFSRTYSHDSEVTDSAPSASAMTTGVKSRNGVINVDSSVPENDCKAGLAHPTTTIAELAEIAGMSTGAVTTTRITHATPAAIYAHAAGRDWERDADMKPEDIAAGCVDIARQLVEMRYGDGLEVAMGGGRAQFLPLSVADPEDPKKTGARKDGRNLVDAWMKRYGEGAAYVWSQPQLQALNMGKTKHLLGLFESSHMQFESARVRDKAGEPSLAEMTFKAISILERNPKGFFLLVEGGRIDHGHHAGMAAQALDDTVAMDEAVKAALAATDARDTLIVVTADHSHVLTMAGYPSRDNPILGLANREDGKPALAKDGKPYTTLSYANGPGAAEGDREDLTNVDTTKPDYRQQALVPFNSETHGGEDVPILASGPWAHLFQGVVDQQYIFHVMNRAGQIKQRAETAIRAGARKR
ncbi:MAG: alkaline phosphatase [Alphaproteobacteria bacterium]|nr:alkaline phosphatase [Alphaproteobacteria bacterium]